ncbi:ankyrin repeat, PH and SEC7 domain containing protein secG-like [Centruroides sculpturatus]|uniref:ankyrin repeat, PH and SEC7 domain containing protein secG-like n=1 Tax=Centruroides sculpturatus TaxID=218467 RepID=UPI000C6E3FF8|nr:ankyrin repeat, PH and SEC7 domain containing protein secG-like [Centruroides sculpturatus]
MAISAYTRDLFLAVANHDTCTVRRIIQSGVELDFVHNGTTPLGLAVCQGNEGIVRLLIRAGADVNLGSCDREGRTEPPLYTACRLSRLDICWLLLESPSIKLDHSDIYLKFPLYIATKEGRYDLVKLLLHKGANVNAPRIWYECPLYLCAKYGGRNRIAECLIVHGSPLDLYDSVGRTPLYWTIEREDRDMFQLLVRAGAQIRPRKRLHPSQLPRSWKNDAYFSAWLEELWRKPLPLTHLIRSFVRRWLSLKWNGLDDRMFRQLPLPPFLIEFLLLERKDD